MWDLAAHDVSILDYIVDEKPVSVVATGLSHTQSGLEDIAYMTLYYASNMIAHVNCSWISPVKIRKVVIGGARKMIVYNDLEPTEKVKVYDCGYSEQTETSRREVLVDYRIGDIYIPKLRGGEALGGVVRDFAQAVESGVDPIADRESGVAVVRLLEAAQRSIKHRGKEVALPWAF